MSPISDVGDAAFEVACWTVYYCQNALESAAMTVAANMKCVRECVLDAMMCGGSKYRRKNDNRECSVNSNYDEESALIEEFRLDIEVGDDDKHEDGFFVFIE